MVVGDRLELLNDGEFRGDFVLLEKSMLEDLPQVPEGALRRRGLLILD